MSGGRGRTTPMTDHHLPFAYRCLMIYVAVVTTLCLLVEVLT